MKVSAEASDAAESNPAPSHRAPPPGSKASGDREYVSESDVERLLRRGPSSVFRAVTVQPVEEEGTFRGYRIVEATPAARRVMKPQLEVGDVVETVNGVPIERPDDYMKAWNKLQERAVFEVEYRRDGETGEAHWVVDERAGRQRSGR